MRWNAAGAEPLDLPLVFIMPFVMFVAIFMDVMKMFGLVDRNRPGETEGKGEEMKWEYKVISVPIEAKSHAELHAQRLEAALNEAGAERWEAVGMLNNKTVLMKRQILTDPRLQSNQATVNPTKATRG